MRRFSWLRQPSCSSDRVRSDGYPETMASCDSMDTHGLRSYRSGPERSAAVFRRIPDGFFHAGKPSGKDRRKTPDFRPFGRGPLNEKRCGRGRTAEVSLRTAFCGPLFCMAGITWSERPQRRPCRPCGPWCCTDREKRPGCSFRYRSSGCSFRPRHRGPESPCRPGA